MMKASGASARTRAQQFEVGADRAAAAHAPSDRPRPGPATRMCRRSVGAALDRVAARRHICSRPAATISSRKRRARSSRSPGEVAVLEQLFEFARLLRDRNRRRGDRRRATSGGTQSAPSPTERMKPSSTSTSCAPAAFELGRASRARRATSTPRPDRPRATSRGRAANGTSAEPAHSKGAAVGCFHAAKPIAAANRTVAVDQLSPEARTARSRRARPIASPVKGSA